MRTLALKVYRLLELAMYYDERVAEEIIGTIIPPKPWWDEKTRGKNNV